MADNEEISKNVYCVTEVYVLKNVSSDTWRLINKYSHPTWATFAHDHLRLGICVNECKKELNMFEIQDSKHDERGMSIVGSLPNYMTKPSQYEGQIIDDINYGPLIDKCVNKRMKKKFGLQVATRINYCNDNEQKSSIIDLNFLNASLFTFICGVVALNVLASLGYGKSSKIIQSFNSSENIKSFLTVNESSDLNILYSIKFYSLLLVIIGHGIMMIGYMFCENGALTEEITWTPFTILINMGRLSIQNFFTIAGFLLGIKFLKPDSELKAAGLLKSIFIRYIGFIPVIILVFLVSLMPTSLLRTDPFLRYYTEKEEIHCKNNFWTNIFMINNFVKPDEPCLQHTWYLAAEFQLFVIGLLIIVLIKRFHRFGIFIGTVCFIVPAIWTVYKVHPSFPGFFSPESGRFLFRNNLFYLKYHLPTYANFDNYFVGLLGSLLYNNTKITQSKLFIKYYHLICVLSVSIYAVGQVIIYLTNFEKSSLLFTIFLTESRKLWGLSLIILIIGCHVNKSRNSAAKFLNWKATVLLGKINLEVYLLHMLIMFILQFGTGPIRATTIESLKFNLSSIFLTYVVSFIVHVFILLPYRKIIKLFT
ncbi:unnamed protein product [Chironomus riparius]|uniref:Acyltransferase 3 domain-containing protein n=1 Tax=Chironomus riparius TaxID=315576 RepID=A0A9N9WM51_9DIPT|nr:unnamed protein product [Chironomus riparius]